MQDDVEEDEEEVVIMIVFEHDQNFWIGFFFTSCSAENIEYHYVHNLDYFVSNFNVHFHVFPQRVCPQRCRDTLAAFVSFFSTLHFPHIAWFRGGIVTLVAFVWLFSTVNFQMSLQIAFLRRFIITLFAFTHFSPRCLNFFFQIQCKKDAKSHWLHLFNLKLSNVSVNCLHTKMHI